MLEKVIAIAIEAGNIIMRVRKEGFETQIKTGPFDVVTTADTKAEEYILQRLMQLFPGDPILSEERGAIGRMQRHGWLVDPLDATKDFKEGGIGFSVMIGRYEDGKPVLGVVYAPAKNILYFGQKGHGSYVRKDEKDYKLAVSSRSYFKDARLVTRIPYEERRVEDKYEKMFRVKERIQEGSIGLKVGLIASGSADFHLSTNFRANKWDTCAPQVILEEAGGVITDFYGNPLDYMQSESRWQHSFVASNGFLHRKVIEKLDGIYR